MTRCFTALAACAIVLAGCGATVTATPDQPRVLFGNEGSIHGGYTVTVLPQEIAILRNRTGAQPVVETRLELEPGSFETLQNMAQTAITQSDASEYDGRPCLDAGTSFVQIDDGEGEVARFENKCDSSDSQDQLDALMQFVNASVVGAP